MNIEITFINQSFDTNNSSVVIFSKNVATDFEELAVAWRVIKNCGRNWSHKFTYPMQTQVGAKDAWGNVSNLQNAINGQKWDIIRSSSGDILSLDSAPASSLSEIEIANMLPQGSIDAQIYKDGKLYAAKNGVAPQQKAVFQFKPTLWVGVVSQVDEGQIMDSAIVSSINTEISLLGINTANLIMTGGGTGTDAQPFEFHLVPTN
ncbi:MAG: hypothetical protein MI974_28925 [Chitinophagales bacterium]|nr:hypothetical protein [Chitinophagales bacterium]